MKDIRKIIRFSIGIIASFISVALVMDFFVSNCILNKAELSNQMKIHRLVEQQDAEEIPIFGSSKARSAFIPEMIHPRAYNYGMQKANFDVVELLLEIELEKERNTPIILEFNHRWFVHKPDHTINSADLVPNREIPKIKEFLGRYDRDDLRFSLPGVRYYGSYIYYIRYFLKKDAGNKKYVSKGGVFADIVPEEEVFDNYVKAWGLRNEKYAELIDRKNDVRKVFSAFDGKHLSLLKEYLLFTRNEEREKRFLELVDSRPDRKFIVAYTPHHECELEGIRNAEEMEDMFEEWMVERDNLFVVDDRSLPLDDRNFKNSTHLNLSGAKAYSKQFAQQNKNLLK